MPWHGNIFHVTGPLCGPQTTLVLLALCEGNPPVTGGFPSQRGSNAKVDDSLSLIDIYYLHAIFTCIASFNPSCYRFGIIPLYERILHAQKWRLDGRLIFHWGLQAGKLALANASENLVGWVENRPGQVEFCISYIRHCEVWASAKFF